MSKNRFTAIGTWLSWYHKGQETENFDKIEELSNILKYNFQQYYQLGEPVSIDESMIGFKGKHKMKQYLPQKPTKWGFKVFVLADTITSYVCDFMYFSKPNENKFRPKEIVSYFSRNLKNHHIYMDNWYTSFMLFEELLQKGIHATGTIRKNRK